MAAINLDQPIKKKDGDKEIEITSVSVREPKTGELLGLGLSVSQIMNANIDHVTKIIPLVTNPMLDASDISQMSLGDVVAISNEIVGFFYNSQMREALKIA